MERIRRNERLGAMARILMETPNRIHNLGEFCTLFSAAKSTVSEDIGFLSDSFRRFGLGSIETVAGAAGGVRYRAIPGPETCKSTLEGLVRRLKDPNRRLPGDFLYTTDICSEPETARRLGEIIAMPYYDAAPDFVLTMETKGIPIALMTARMLDIPLVIARRDSKAYEGASVKITYIAGEGRTETMALPRRAVKSGQKALIVDDFVKGGGTLSGMVDMMKEFECSVAGISVLIATATHAGKRPENLRSLLLLEGFDEQNRAVVRVQNDQ